MAWEVHHGSITKAIFLNFMRTRVLPQCTPGGSGPRSVVVMNNARIHQSIELDQLCMEFGVLLIKLPPYSPDFNPIETSFAVLKA
jgi:transposase